MHEMRFLLAAACLVLASCLHVRVIEGRPGDIEFSTHDATDDSYQNFISALRGLLTSGTTTANDISVPNSKPFILVDLSNRIRSTIILAIDKENTNVVAYVAGDKSYFLKDAPVAALNTLFPPTTIFYLPFTSSYTDLEKAGRKSRWEIPLGLTPLDNAITALWEGGDSKAAQSLLVTTQMVLEATKSILVEQRVRDSIQEKGDFLPDAGILANRGILDSSGCPPSGWLPCMLLYLSMYIYVIRYFVLNVTTHKVFLVDEILLPSLSRRLLLILELGAVICRSY